MRFVSSDSNKLRLYCSIRGTHVRHDRSQHTVYDESMKPRIVLACVVLSVLCFGEAMADGQFEELGRLLGAGIDAVLGAALQYLDALPIRFAVDDTNPITRAFVLSCIKSKHGGSYNVAQVCDIWDRCYENRVYISDPYSPFDKFFDASETIQVNLRGDCDDFAILIAAGIRAIGGTAMIMREFTATDGHAYTCVYVGSDQETVVYNLSYVAIRYSIEVESPEDVGLLWFEQHPEWGYWMSLDWQVDHPGSPRWANSRMITSASYMPTPSVLGLLSVPILIPPDPNEAVRILEAEYGG